MGIDAFAVFDQYCDPRTRNESLMKDDQQARERAFARAKPGWVPVSVLRKKGEKQRFYLRYFSLLKIMQRLMHEANRLRKARKIDEANEFGKYAETIAQMYLWLMPLEKTKYGTFGCDPRYWPVELHNFVKRLRTEPTEREERLRRQLEKLQNSRPSGRLLTMKHVRLYKRIISIMEKHNVGHYAAAKIYLKANPSEQGKRDYDAFTHWVVLQRKHGRRTIGELRKALE